MAGAALILKTTPLHAWHAAHGGRLVEFSGWSMPVQYTTIADEHRAVRNAVGLFDIGHMGRLRFGGPGARARIDRATTNNVAKLATGRIQYSLMVHDDGGVLDDILVYRLADGYVVVCNASNRDAVVARFESLHDAGIDDASMVDTTLDTAMIAVQGPRAAEVAARVVDGPLLGLGYYRAAEAKVGPTPALVSRTGYTGEDGFELIVAANEAESTWLALLDAGAEFGIVPCGLGARDTLRFEAAMPLYGHEMDATVNPYAAGLGWAIRLDKGEFAGRESLRKFEANPGATRVGLQLAGKRIARQGAIVLVNGYPAGVVTSGTFSPTLDRSLAMARVGPEHADVGTKLDVDVRGRIESAVVVELPFYRRPRAASPA